MERIYQRGIITTDDVLDFGKHNGEQVYYVIYYHPKYIRWCLETIEEFHLDDEAFSMLENSLFNTPQYTDS